MSVCFGACDKTDDKTKRALSQTRITSLIFFVQVPKAVKNMLGGGFLRLFLCREDGEARDLADAGVAVDERGLIFNCPTSYDVLG